MQYVQQYVFAKYPQYCNGLVEEGDNKIDLDDKQKNYPTSGSTRELSSPASFNTYLSYLDRTQLEPSRLLDILTKKSSFQGSFISIPESSLEALWACRGGLLGSFHAQLQGCYDDDWGELPFLQGKFLHDNY